MPCKQRPLPNTNGGCRYSSPLTPHASSESSPSRSLSFLRLLSLLLSSTQDPSLPVVYVDCLRSSLKALVSHPMLLTTLSTHTASATATDQHTIANSEETLGGPGGSVRGCTAEGQISPFPPKPPAGPGGHQRASGANPPRGRPRGGDQRAHGDFRAPSPAHHNKHHNQPLGSSLTRGLTPLNRRRGPTKGAEKLRHRAASSRLLLLGEGHGDGAATPRHGFLTAPPRGNT